MFFVIVQQRHNQAQDLFLWLQPVTVITTLFTKLTWPEHSKGIFRASSHVASYLPAYHTRWDFTLLLFITERQAMSIKFLIFDLNDRESNQSLSFQ